MLVTLIASDESTAPLYRVRVLARMLQLRHQVQVVGFNFGESDPLAPRDFPYQELRVHGWKSYWQALRSLSTDIQGEVLYAMKPRPSSLGSALLLGRLRKIPVLLDVDDWEPYLVHPYSKHALKNLLYALPRLGHPNAYPYTWAADRATSLAQGVTVVSTFFQKRYGGTLLPQYVDTARFDPALYDRAAIRAELGIAPGERVVVFGGIAQPNKGVDLILDALRAHPGLPWRLLIAGPRTPHAASMTDDPRVLLTGTIAPEQTPRYLACGDLVILPQRDEPASHGQMPMKLFEAMAMGLPVIATNLADIPEVLSGCGIAVPPGDPGALAQAAEALLGDDGLRQALGGAARERCVRFYDWHRGCDRLTSALEALPRPAASGWRRASTC